MRRSERCGRVPVLVITSSEAPAERKRAMELGATEYFIKPSALEDFMRIGKMVRRICERASGVAA